jgi:hypothetical protein
MRRQSSSHPLHASSPTKIVIAERNERLMQQWREQFPGDV